MEERASREEDQGKRMMKQTKAVREKEEMASTIMKEGANLVHCTDEHTNIVNTVPMAKYPPQTHRPGTPSHN